MHFAFVVLFLVFYKKQTALCPYASADATLKSYVGMELSVSLGSTKCLYVYFLLILLKEEPKQCKFSYMFCSEGKGKMLHLKNLLGSKLKSHQEVPFSRVPVGPRLGFLSDPTLCWSQPLHFL